MYLGLSQTLLTRSLARRPSLAVDLSRMPNWQHGTGP